MKFYADYVLKQGNKYLVENSKVDSVIDALNRLQSYLGEYMSITVKPYTGKKYADCSWVVEG